MATTKTLTPTNQTITIAAFSGEKPDQRQIADAESKMADAINAVNSQLVPISDDYIKRITPFFSANSGNNNVTMTFNGVNANEGISLLIFTRYGSHVVTMAINANAQISGYDVNKLTGTNTLSISVGADGKSISFNVGNYSSVCGLFIHPHFPDATLTITRSA